MQSLFVWDILGYPGYPRTCTFSLWYIPGYPGEISQDIPEGLVATDDHRYLCTCTNNQNCIKPNEQHHYQHVAIEKSIISPTYNFA